MSANASEMFAAMLSAVEMHHWVRESSDPCSPTRSRTLEAKPGRTFELRNTAFNVADRRKPERRWAVANVLQFFAGAEDAPHLSKYCRFAEKFAPGGVWKGAYGAIAMPQICRCVAKLKESPNTRRAIVSMGGFEPDEDVNRPACWNFLHFLLGRDGLDMLCYQRSLNLWGVFPYDCILLSAIHRFVCFHTELSPGSLYWTCGSLHMKEQDLKELVPADGRRNIGLLLPNHLLTNISWCLEQLADSSKVEALACGS